MIVNKRKTMKKMGGPQVGTEGNGGGSEVGRVGCGGGGGGGNVGDAVLWDKTRFF